MNQSEQLLQTQQMAKSTKLTAPTAGRTVGEHTRGAFILCSGERAYIIILESSLELTFHS